MTTLTEGSVLEMQRCFLSVPMQFGAAWCHLGAALGGCGGYLGLSWTILWICWENLVITWAEGSVHEMQIRFRAAPVQ